MAMDSSVHIDRYVFDTLMRDLVGHDRRPSAFLVYAALAAEASGGRPTLSHAQLAEHTGLSKRSVQDGLRHLEGRGLVALRRGSPTEAATITVLKPWVR